MMAATIGNTRRRRWDTGLERPYRTCPADFRERYLEMGWDGIDEHYRTNYRCIRRWIEECGGDELRNARAAVTGATLRPKLRSKRFKPYAMPRRPIAAKPARWPSDAPCFWDMGLMPGAQAVRIAAAQRRHVSAARLIEQAIADADEALQAGMRAAVALLRGEAG